MRLFDWLKCLVGFGYFLLFYFYFFRLDLFFCGFLAAGLNVKVCNKIRHLFVNFFLCFFSHIEWSCKCANRKANSKQRNRNRIRIGNRSEPHSSAVKTKLRPAKHQPAHKTAPGAQRKARSKSDGKKRAEDREPQTSAPKRDLWRASLCLKSFVWTADCELFAWQIDKCTNVYRCGDLDPPGLLVNKQPCAHTHLAINLARMLLATFPPIPRLCHWTGTPHPEKHTLTFWGDSWIGDYLICVLAQALLFSTRVRFLYWLTDFWKWVSVKDFSPLICWDFLWVISITVT